MRARVCTRMCIHVTGLRGGWRRGEQEEEEEEEGAGKRERERDRDDREREREEKRAGGGGRRKGDARELEYRASITPKAHIGGFSEV